jgi:hypothetical protein
MYYFDVSLTIMDKMECLQWHGMDLPATADPDANPGVASLLSDPSADQAADGFSKTLSMRKI